MNKVVKIALVLVLSSLAVSVPELWAAWVEDGVPICTATAEQAGPQIVSDGAGGAIITWYDKRSGNYDIYAQRIDASGAVQWTADGVPICTATATSHVGPQITSDGAGGAVITWHNFIPGTDSADIYAQRVDASGAVQWTADGVPICTATDLQLWPKITSDGASGAIITWVDKRSGGWHVYAQRVDASGAVQWTADGVSICPGTAQQFEPRIVSDGAGGAIIAWDDTRSGTNTDIYAQRVNASGTVQWAANGIAVSTASRDQLHMELVSDGASGAIFAWDDKRGGDFEIDIYVQRVDASGAVQWAANGLPICTATRNQQHPDIVSDGAGGGIITWQDLRNGATTDVYAQRVDASGSAQWMGDGVAICTAALDQDDLKISTDSAAGAIITWHDDRSATVGDGDIYAQRVDASGAVRWTADGVPICTAPGDQSRDQITSDGAGGGIITWQDARSGSIDIYALLIDQFGRPGGVVTGVDALKTPPMSYIAQNYPNPFNPYTTIRFGLKERSPVSLRIYDTAGRLVRALVDEPRAAGDFDEAWDGRDDTGDRVAAGVYFCRLKVRGISQTRKMVLLR